jgi:uncharacterized protein YndB with AHSA1/START domain
MQATSFTYSGTIGAPIDKVFAIISDPTRMPEWLPRCRAVIPAPEIRGKGDRHRIQFEHGVRPRDAVIEIIDYTPPLTFGWVEVYQRRGSKTFFALGFEGGSTKITMKHIWTPANWRSWLLGQFYRRRNARKMFDALLQNLRKVLTR